MVGAGGGVAETHLGVIAANPEFKLAALCDIAAEPVGERAKKAGVPVFSDWREMLKGEKLDLVSITTPHPLHPAIAIDAMEAGCHVLAEKPMAVDVASADRMVEAAEKTGKILAVNFQNRLRAVYEHARRIIAGGELGELIRVLCVEPHYRSDAYYRSATWRGKWNEEGGGVLMNQAPHTQDMLCHLVGPPKKVWGWVRTRFHPMECEDSAQAMLEYPNGAPGYIVTNTVEPGLEGRFQIVGEKAVLDIAGDTIRMTRITPAILEHMRGTKEKWGAPEARGEEVPVPAGGGGRHADVYRDLAGAIRENRPPRCDGKEGRMSLELANAMVLSSVTDRAVTLPIDRAAYAKVLDELRQKKRL